MPQRRRISNALRGFVEGFLPMYQAAPLREYQLAQAEELRRQSQALEEFLSLYQDAQEAPLTRVLPRPGQLGETRKEPLFQPITSGTIGRMPEPSVGRDRADPRARTSPSDQTGPFFRHRKRGGAFVSDPLARRPLPWVSHAGAGAPVPPGQPGIISPQRFTSGTTMPDYAMRAPRKYDEGLERLHLFAGMTGLPGLQGALRPLEATEEYEAFEKRRDAMIDSVNTMLRATPTAVTFTDNAGNDRTTYMNMSIATNPWLVDWAKANMPELAYGLPGGMVGETGSPGPYETGPSSSARNAAQIRSGATPEQMAAEAAHSSLDPENPMHELFQSEPLGGMMPAPWGGVSVVNLTESNKKFLAQMIPLANVTMQMADYAYSLNTEDVRFIARLKALGQTVDSWFGTEYFLDPREIAAPGTPEITDAERTARAAAITDSAARKARLTDAERNELIRMQSRASDDLQHFARLRNAFAGLFAELGGERGRKTEDDVKRAKQMLVGLGAAAGLTKRAFDHIFGDFTDQYLAIKHGVFTVLDPKQRQMEAMRDRAVRSTPPGTRLFMSEAATADPTLGGGRLPPVAGWRTPSGGDASPFVAPPQSRRPQRESPRVGGLLR